MDRPEEIGGISFETLFFQEIKAVNDNMKSGYGIYYWRTPNNFEVDFVLYGEKGIIAFEVKRTGKVNNKMLKGLKVFIEQYPSAKAYFIYGGERKMSHGNIEILPIVDALKNLPKILTL